MLGGALDDLVELAVQPRLVAPVGLGEALDRGQRPIAHHAG